MDEKDITLIAYELENRENYSELVHVLNKNKQWQLIVNKLHFYDEKVYFSDRAMAKMVHSSSPAEILLYELKIRNCTVGNLIAILDKYEVIDALSVLKGTGKLEIVEHPGENDQLIRVNPSGVLRLKCRAVGRSSLCYQWYCYNTPLFGFNESELLIRDFRKEQTGDYYCIVSQFRNNTLEEIYSNTVHCSITETPPVFIKQNLTVEESKILKVCTENKVKSKASAKAALLIANEKYENYNNLETPCNDVDLLAKILKKLQFHVITLINLSFNEMRNAIVWFYRILPHNAFAFFYYVGHGFEINNNKFMMPVDCPTSNELRMAHCLCEDVLIQEAMTVKIELLVAVLDMCLKPPDRDENPGIFSEATPNFEYTRNGKSNFIQAYSTSSNQRSYEKTKRANGKYMEYLSKHLLCDMPFVDILGLVHAELFEDETVGKKQRPCARFDNVKNCKLTDHAHRNHMLDAKIATLTTIKDIHKLSFPQVGLEADIHVQPHKGHILNAIDIFFDKKLSQWDVDADVSPEVLNQYKWTKENDGRSLLTLYNLQKVKSDVCITVKLINKDTFNIAGLGFLDLGILFIAHARLWFEMSR